VGLLRILTLEVYPDAGDPFADVVAGCADR
jgi:hypothetical protein